MKKRAVSITFLCLVIAAALGTAVWSKQDHWSVFTKLVGLFQMQDGKLTQIPGEKDKNEVVESIDPITAIPSKKLEVKTIDNQQQLVTMKLQGLEKEFHFVVSYVGKRPVILRDNNQEFVLTSIPKSNNTLMEYDGNLYIVKVDDNKIEKALLDKVGPYDIDQLGSKRYEETSLTWGTSASISPDGSKMIFHTLRNAIIDDNLNGQMWLKDFETGKESKIYDSAFSVLGWGEGNDIYIRTLDANGMLSIEKFDVEAGVAEPLNITFAVVGFSYPYIMYQDEAEKLVVVNLESNDKKDVMFDSLNIVRSMRVLEGSPWAMVFNAPDRTKPENNVAIVNMESGEVRILSEPPNSYFTDGQWIDDTQLIINTRIKGSTEDETYIINRNDVKGE